MKTLTGLSGSVITLGGAPLLEADGKRVTVGAILANTLARGSSSQPVRAMSLALTIYNAEDSLEVEDSDFELLRDAVVKDQLLNNMAKAAALVVLGETGGAQCAIP